MSHNLFFTPSREWKISKFITQRVWMYAYLSYNYSTLPLLLESSVKCQCFLKLRRTICLFSSVPSITTEQKDWSIEFLSPLINLSRSTKMTFLLYKHAYVNARTHILLLTMLFLMLGFNSKSRLNYYLWYIFNVCVSDLEMCLRYNKRNVHLTIVISF